MNVGQKVICVSDTPCDCCGETLASIGIKIGQTFVIRGVEYDDGKYWLKLVGVIFPNDGEHEADLLDACDFRLLDELKQQNKAKQQEGVKRVVRH